MSGCCGPLCSKTFVILYNIIFWISGCALVGGGAYVLYDIGYTHIYNLFNTPEKYSSEYLSYGAYATVALGGLILFIGFFGCCGALQDSKCMLGTYIFFMILICFAEAIIALGCVYCHYYTIPSDTKTKLKEQVVAKYGVPEHQQLTLSVDYLQAHFKCCGITGSKDHDEIRNTRGMGGGHSHNMNMNTNMNMNMNMNSGIQTPRNYPLTCCKQHEGTEEPWLKPNPLNPASCQDTVQSVDRYSQGCWKELENWMFIHMLIISGTTGGLALLQILGVLFSLCLIRNIGEDVS